MLNLIKLMLKHHIYPAPTASPQDPPDFLTLKQVLDMPPYHPPAPQRGTVAQTRRCDRIGLAQNLECR